MAIVERQEKVATRCCFAGLAPTLHYGINLPQARAVSQDDQEMAPHVPHRGTRQPRSPVEEGCEQSTPGADHEEKGALGQNYPRAALPSRRQQNGVDVGDALGRIFEGTQRECFEKHGISIFQRTWIPVQEGSKGAYKPGSRIANPSLNRSRQSCRGWSSGKVLLY